jgi:hypothetical protein
VRHLRYLDADGQPADPVFYVVRNENGDETLMSHALIRRGKPIKDEEADRVAG